MIKEVELINKYKFIKAALDKDSETYIVYIITLENIEAHSLKAVLLATL